MLHMFHLFPVFSKTGDFPAACTMETIFEWGWNYLTSLDNFKATASLISKGTNICYSYDLISFHLFHINPVSKEKIFQLQSGSVVRSDDRQIDKWMLMIDVPIVWMYVPLSCLLHCTCTDMDFKGHSLIKLGDDMGIMRRNWFVLIMVWWSSNDNNKVNVDVYKMYRSALQSQIYRHLNLCTVYYLQSGIQIHT